MATAEEIDNRRSPRERVAPLPPSCHLADVENQLGPTFLTRYLRFSRLSSSLVICDFTCKRKREREREESGKRIGSEIFTTGETMLRKTLQLKYRGNRGWKHAIYHFCVPVVPGGASVLFIVFLTRLNIHRD